MYVFVPITGPVKNISRGKRASYPTWGGPVIRTKTAACLRKMKLVVVVLLTLYLATSADSNDCMGCRQSLLRPGQYPNTHNDLYEYG